VCVQICMCVRACIYTCTRTIEPSCVVGYTIDLCKTNLKGPPQMIPCYMVKIKPCLAKPQKVHFCHTQQINVRLKSVLPQILSIFHVPGAVRAENEQTSHGAALIGLTDQLGDKQ
jgi:hypothetical protein